MSAEVLIKPMQLAHVSRAVRLVAEAMNPNEAVYAAKTFEFYFDCKQNAVDSARHYFCAWQNDELVGLTGLHHFRWGPAENVWLSWFAVHPAYRRRGIGKQLIDYAEQMAIQSGYKKLFVETYDSHEFTDARAFYVGQGFTQTGRIENYIDDKSAMLVYGKEL